MIILPDKDLHRLRQLRDDLDWLGKIVDEQLYKNKPWRHYGITIRTAQMVVGSIIRNVEWKMKNEEGSNGVHAGSYVGDRTGLLADEPPYRMD